MIQWTRLNARHRRMAMAALFVLATLASYLVIMRRPLRAFWAAWSAESALERQETELALVEAEYHSAQRRLLEAQRRHAETQSLCCHPAQAQAFFEQITSWATEFSLSPLSRVVSSPKAIGDANTTPLIQQSAEVVVQGSIQDLIAFLTMLTDRPQKVCLTNLRIGLIPGEDFEPRASFRVVLVIDPQLEAQVS